MHSHNKSTYTSAKINAEMIAIKLLGEPNFARTTTELRWGTNGSMLVTLAGDMAGRFHDFESGLHGDMVDLVQEKLAMTHVEACGWVSSYLGKETAPLSTNLPSFSLSPRGNQNSDYAAALWHEAKDISGTAGSAYLQHRLCDYLSHDDISSLGLMWLSGSRGVPGAIGCIVAKMVDPQTGAFRGIHRTFLSKKFRRMSRKLLGPAGFICLAKPASGAGDVLIAEGIETALSAALLFPHCEVWAAGSASMLANFPVLQHTLRISICADHDIANGQNATGNRAARTCADRYIAAGIAATIHTPKAAGSDFNDVLRACANSQVASDA